MSQRRRRRRKEPTGAHSTGGAARDPRLKLEPLHVGLIVAGAAVAVLGFWLLSRGSISAAPALLLVAFLVLIPLGVALPSRETRSDPSDGS